MNTPKRQRTRTELAGRIVIYAVEWYALAEILWSLTPHEHTLRGYVLVGARRVYIRGLAHPAVRHTLYLVGHTPPPLQ